MICGTEKSERSQKWSGNMPDENAGEKKDGTNEQQRPACRVEPEGKLTEGGRRHRQDRYRPEHERT